jgi:hypothetical protein
VTVGGGAAPGGATVVIVLLDMSCPAASPRLVAAATSATDARLDWPTASHGTRQAKRKYLHLARGLWLGEEPRADDGWIEVPITRQRRGENQNREKLPPGYARAVHR